MALSWSRFAEIWEIYVWGDGSLLNEIWTTPWKDIVSPEQDLGRRRCLLNKISNWPPREMALSWSRFAMIEKSKYEEMVIHWTRSGRHHEMRLYLLSKIWEGDGVSWTGFQSGLLGRWRSPDQDLLRFWKSRYEEMVICCTRFERHHERSSTDTMLIRREPSL